MGEEMTLIICIVFYLAFAYMADEHLSEEWHFAAGWLGGGLTTVLMMFLKLKGIS